MAPRTAKAKKAADVKVAENDAPKKGRGKAKAVEEPEQEVPEVEIDEKPAVADKKAKRGKKAQENGDAQTNGTVEEVAPPAKRGRKKKEVEPEESAPEASNGDHTDEEVPTAEEEKNTESNGTEEALAANGKGRKKAVKKEEKPKETARGRKAKQASPDEEEKQEKVVEEKPKGKGRGRKAKAEATPEPEEDEPEPEEAKPEPAAKGRKKAQPKAAKEKSPEPEESPEEAEKPDEPEEKPEAPKKEPKGRKGKKAPAKEEGQDTEEKEPASKKRKVNKKDEKGQGDTKEDEVAEDAPEEEIEEARPKGKRGKKETPAASAPEPSAEAEDESADSEASSKRRRKPTEEKAPAEDNKKKAPAKNKTATNYDEIDFSNHSKNAQGKEWNFKIACWNVDGIRAWMSKGGLDYIKYEKPDILCLQETKCAKDKLPEELTNLPGYHAYWVESDKDGYAGVGLYTTRLAMNVQYGLGDKELDDEGRIITAEYEQFYLICTYVPNAGRKLVTLPRRLQWNKAFQNYVKELNHKKPVIICGDMNVAHDEIDLANPKANRKNAGFTDEERAGMTELLGAGFVDTYRHFNPDKTGAYTFWTYMMNSRSKNVGWRLDYFLVSERLLPAVCDNVIRSEVYGSDHCPITLFLHITTADKPKEP